MKKVGYFFVTRPIVDPCLERGTVLSILIHEVKLGMGIRYRNIWPLYHIGIPFRKSLLNFQPLKLIGSISQIVINGWTNRQLFRKSEKWLDKWTTFFEKGIFWSDKLTTCFRI